MGSLQQAATVPSSSFRSIPSARSLSFTGSAAFPNLRRAAIVPSLTLRRGGGARMSGTVAATYAQALADVANSAGTLEATVADIEKVEKLFTDEQVFKYIMNPVVGEEKKRALVNEIAADAGISPTTANFLNILVDSKRIDLIKEVVKEFDIVYNRYTETELALVTSVVALEPQHLSQIAKQVQKLTGAKNVRIKTAIDPTLVAGFTVRYGSSFSKLIDMSVKRQLEEIASQLEIGDITLAA